MRISVGKQSEDRRASLRQVGHIFEGRVGVPSQVPDQRVGLERGDVIGQAAVHPDLPNDRAARLVG